MGFSFEEIVLKEFKTSVIKQTLSEVFNKGKNGEGQSTEQTSRIGVYALYYNNRLKKIGKAVCPGGIFKRMSQYYRGKDGSISYITSRNREAVQVQYFNLLTVKDCWAAEKFLQSMAYYENEPMPWDDELNKVAPMN